MNLYIINTNKYVNIIILKYFISNLQHVWVSKLGICNHAFTCSYLFEISANMWIGNQTVKIKGSIYDTED